MKSIPNKSAKNVKMHMKRMYLKGAQRKTSYTFGSGEHFYAYRQENLKGTHAFERRKKELLYQMIQTKFNPLWCCG